MAADQGVTSSSSSSASLLIPSRTEPQRHAEPRPLPATSPIVNPRSGADGAAQTQAPRPPAAPCGPPGPFRPCWNLDLRVAMLLVTVAGGLILLLLFRLLQLRRRLQTARSRPALKYYRFYHAATYTLRPPGPRPAPPGKEGPAPDQTGTPPPPPPPPPLLPLPHPPVVLRTPPTPPPPLLLRHSAPASPPHPTTPLFLTPALGCATPPSPHLSWGAASDVAEVYSRIGAFRPARLSSLSSQTQVILFEHSSL